MKTGLLDVNVLIALLDSSHVSHEAAHEWFDANRQFGWATCPITENSCARIMSTGGYPFPGLTVERVRSMLAELVTTEGHQFWPDSISLLDASRFDLAVARPKQLTDLYLLGLAVQFGGRLVTFDRSIRWQSVSRCTAENLVTL